MAACTHAFADPHEATIYAMLQCVLQHHRTTHAVSLLAGLTAPVLLCAGTGMQRCAAGGVEEGPLMPQTLAGLSALLLTDLVFPGIRRRLLPSHRRQHS